MDVGEVRSLDRLLLDGPGVQAASGQADRQGQAIRSGVWFAGNISQAGTPPSLVQGYGTAFEAGFLKLWGLS